MGTDITASIEYGRKKHDYWRHFAVLGRMSRNYRIFSAMAGVRSEVGLQPEVPLRGFPSDATFRTEEAWPRKDNEGNRLPDWTCHSPGWLWTDEFEEAVNRGGSFAMGWIDEDYAAALAAMKSLESSGYIARIIFWFGD